MYATDCRRIGSKLSFRHQQLRPCKTTRNDNLYLYSAVGLRQETRDENNFNHTIYLCLFCCFGKTDRLVIAQQEREKSLNSQLSTLNSKEPLSRNRHVEAELYGYRFCNQQTRIAIHFRYQIPAKSGNAIMEHKGRSRFFCHLHTAQHLGYISGVVSFSRKLLQPRFLGCMADKR